ncbi:hypothetical protein LTR94_027393, partial [Friedmanniomyces endolithicus]
MAYGTPCVTRAFWSGPLDPAIHHDFPKIPSFSGKPPTFTIQPPSPTRRSRASIAAMFIGHYAPAFVAAALPGRARPRLGAVFVAAQLVDVAFFLFVLAGIEHMRLTPGHTAMNAGDFWDMRYTHSLIGTFGFAAGWAVVARLRRQSWRVAWIGAAVVASHWLLDWLVHAPDLTLLGAGHRYGLALWNRPQIEMPLELGLTALAGCSMAPPYQPPAVSVPATYAEAGSWTPAAPGDAAPSQTWWTAFGDGTLDALETR